VAATALADYPASQSGEQLTPEQNKLTAAILRLVRTRQSRRADPLIDATIAAVSSAGAAIGLEVRVWAAIDLLSLPEAPVSRGIEEPGRTAASTAGARVQHGGPRFVAETDTLSQLDQRPNLMDLSFLEFEALIQNLFTKMGLEARQTRPSRDGGVDCVAWDPRPIFGGKVIIQAKGTRTPSASPLSGISSEPCRTKAPAREPS